jgi:hypothetical protein
VTELSRLQSGPLAGETDRNFGLGKREASSSADPERCIQRAGPEHDAIRKALKYVDAEVRSKHSVKRLETVVDLTCSNASSVGLSYVLAVLLFDLAEAQESREQEPQSQEADFWSGVGRVPNHYARTIAL